MTNQAHLRSAFHEGTNKKSQEVELRVLLTPEQRGAILKQLEGAGACFAGKETMVDLYYCPKGVTSFSQIAMDAVGSFSLRVRQTVQDGVATVQINTKTITTYGDHHAWQEHELTVDSFAEAQKLLQLLGYKVFCRIEKERARFRVDQMAIDQMTICIDDIRDFGCALEIEIMATEETAHQAKETIKQFLACLGIGREQILPKSVTYLIMQSSRGCF